MPKITIDGVEVDARNGMNILGAASKAGAKIPTLCWMKKLNDIGSCRMCVVEVEGEDGLVAACNTQVREGMVVKTNSPRVIRARRSNMRTLLDNHRSQCTTCARSGSCALQALAADLGMTDDVCSDDAFVSFGPSEWDYSFPLQRDATKCIKCMRCVAECSKVQFCSVWESENNGLLQDVRTSGDGIAASGCALCGQCITHCPTGALTERDDIDRVIAALADPDVMTVAQVAPAVRAAWGENIGLSKEEATTGRMVEALRALGFDYVFDTDFAADLTIMEEGSEFIEFMKTEHSKPMFTSCCPGWVRFAKLHYPQFVENLSSAKSPHQMMGAVIKNTMSGQAGGVTGDTEGERKIFVVSIMPCTAKKYECDVPELSTAGGADVDCVLTVREFDRMLTMFSVNCAALDEGDFDDPLGESTGASVIFGRTGGVMEAALRTAVTLMTGSAPDLSALDCTDATPDRPWVEKTLPVNGKDVRIAIASGLANTAKLLDAIESGEATFDFVEIMACPGGCAGGGGQPIFFNKELAAPRSSVLNNIDNSKELRMSHENPDIKALYEKWLDAPLSHTAHEWLHTDQETWTI